MLYWLFYEKLFHFFTPFRVFQYATVRTAFASLTALFLCIGLGPVLIRKLRQIQIGQYIREDGPQSHTSKAGTPTMGGLLIVISIFVPTLLWANLPTPMLDLVVRHVFLRRHRFLRRLHQADAMRNLGLTARQKLFWQLWWPCRRRVLLVLPLPATIRRS